MQAIIAARLFTGAAMLTDHAVLIEAGRICDVVPAAGIAGERLADDLILAPGFIDVQVNGGGGVLFNDSPDLPGLRRIVCAHRRFGTTALLPTLITDTEAKLRQAVATVGAAMAAAEPGVAGLHLEGPFLNPARRGVHRAAFMRPLLAADLHYLRATAPRPLLLTLAPEMVPPDTIHALTASGIVVSIGHTEATYEQARACGARGVTHLFNAMPPPTGRAPGPVGAALDGKLFYAGIIVDGHHVHPASLRVALHALTPARTMLVTDAMASVGADIDSFLLQGQRIAVVRGAVSGGRLVTADGTLAGAHLDMASAVRNAVAMMGATLPDALRMASATPADFLGIGAERGRLLPGRAADMVAITEDVDIRAVWVGGAPALVGSDTGC